MKRRYLDLIQSAKYYTITFYGELLNTPKENVQDFLESRNDIELEKCFMFWRLSPSHLKQLCIYILNIEIKTTYEKKSSE